VAHLPLNRRTTPADEISLKDSVQRALIARA
jgi:hypothetical protein